MVGLDKNNFMQLSLTLICERNTETYKWSYFALLLFRLKKYPKYNYIPQPQSSVGVLDKLYSVTYDKFVFAFHLEVSSHFSLNSSKYFAPPRLEEELGIMWFCVLASGGGKIPGLKGFYETGRQRIPTACWCHFVLHSTCTCVGRD